MSAWYWQVPLPQKIHACSKISSSGCTEVLRTMYVTQCEQGFHVTPCRLMRVVHFLCSYVSAKTTRKPYNYNNWHLWHQQGPNSRCPTGGTVI